MKRVFIGLLVFSLMLMVGCSSDGANGDTDINTDQLLENLIEKISSDLRAVGYTDDDFQGEELPGYIVIDLTDEELEFSPYVDIIDFDKVEGAFTIQAAMMLNSDRITVFKVSDDSYLSEIKTILEEEKQGQYDMWREYLQDQFAKVEKTILEVEGNLIYYITYEDAEGIEDVILNSGN